MKIVRYCAAAPFYVVGGGLLCIGVGLTWIAAAIAGEFRINDCLIAGARTRACR